MNREIVNSKGQKKNYILKEIRGWSFSIGLAVIVALVINIFVLELYTVQQNSMMPTFHDGDRVMAWKLSHFLKMEPDYGDIVIVDSKVEKTRKFRDEIKESALINRVTGNENPNIWIKRVIGKPGDLLEFKDNRVYRNGEPLEESYLMEEMRVPFETVTVADNHIFVMGDNRNNSKDSRSIGAIPLENIRGSVILRFLPLNRWKIF